ncbi:hypothetical protein CASFOL_023952 [Castilleja foliolosa]|uniref:DCD domain-containing protein n=1 Tax=Castilleja foliolosa TaxID=1961234 RepID=A0ABD3CLX9_9LAMI
MMTTSEPESHPGFIFMCNSSTKLECYQYRVFGLPMGKKEVVEVIKPGAKLFLFDFQLKLLYGVYEATSAGKMNLEHVAFGGKFPAQVKFRIFKECLPLPERVLRNIIEENYTGNKFNPELSRNQVKNLLSSFRPLTASSSSQPASHALANVSLSRAMRESLLEMEVPYSGEMRYNIRAPSIVEPQHNSNMNIFPYGHQRTPTVNPTPDLQSLASAISYYVTNSQQSAFAHVVHEPSNSRYLNVDKSDVSTQVTDFERRFHQPPLQREAEQQAVPAPTMYNTSAGTQYVASAPYQDNNAASSYTSNPAAAALSSSQYPSYQDYTAVAYNSNSAALSSSQDPAYQNYNYNPAAPSLPQYAAYQDYNAVTYNSNSAALSSSQDPAYQNYNSNPAAPSLPQYAAYQDCNAVAYNSNSAALSSSQDPAYQNYNSNPAAPSLPQYAAHQDYNAVAYAGIPQGNDPASAYYSYYAANQLSR